MLPCQHGFQRNALNIILQNQKLPVRFRLYSPHAGHMGRAALLQGCVYLSLRGGHPTPGQDASGGGLPHQKDGALGVQRIEKLQFIRHDSSPKIVSP